MTDDRTLLEKAATSEQERVDAARWRWLVAQHNTFNPIAQVVWKRGSKPNGVWVNLIDGHDLIAHVDRAAAILADTGEVK
jgi:hypothetical protein